MDRQMQERPKDQRKTNVDNRAAGVDSNTLMSFTPINQRIIEPPCIGSNVPLEQQLHNKRPNGSHKYGLSETAIESLPPPAKRQKTLEREEEYQKGEKENAQVARQRSMPAPTGNGRHSLPSNPPLKACPTLHRTASIETVASHASPVDMPRPHEGSSSRSSAKQQNGRSKPPATRRVTSQSLQKPNNTIDQTINITRPLSNAKDTAKDKLDLPSQTPSSTLVSNHVLYKTTEEALKSRSKTVTLSQTTLSKLKTFMFSSSQLPDDGRAVSEAPTSTLVSTTDKIPYVSKSKGNPTPGHRPRDNGAITNRHVSRRVSSHASNDGRPTESHTRDGMTLTANEYQKIVERDDKNRRASRSISDHHETQNKHTTSLDTPAPRGDGQYRRHSGPTYLSEHSSANIPYKHHTSNGNFTMITRVPKNSERESNGRPIAESPKDSDDEFDEGVDDNDLLDMLQSTNIDNINVVRNVVQPPERSCRSNSIVTRHAEDPKKLRGISKQLDVDDEYDMSDIDEEDMLRLPDLTFDITHNSDLAHEKHLPPNANIANTSRKICSTDAFDKLSTSQMSNRHVSHTSQSSEQIISQSRLQSEAHIRDIQNHRRIHTSDNQTHLAEHPQISINKTQLFHPQNQAKVQYFQDASATMSAHGNNDPPALFDPNYIPMSTFARPNFPTPVRDRSPIIGLTNKSFLRTCFKMGEMFKEGKRYTALEQDAIIELFARVKHSQREAGTTKQHFTFMDLWRDHPPHPEGVLENHKSTPLAEKESRELLTNVSEGAENGELKIVRCIGRLKRDAKSKIGWLLHIMNIRETDWEEIRWTKQIVSAGLMKSE